ncbi:putative Xaa-Pro aminopeptidase P [Diplodia seriata]|uniref:Putative Xaa-Pro aminopeptidase P n=1 Tax=Diplodia seriata TaxID=420778 RepID=A0A1S8B8Y3_9PEZI|nr:putative Xaa-Pro aminopeptidase P [Diplodia seriata]
MPTNRLRRLLRARKPLRILRRVPPEDGPRRATAAAAAADTTHKLGDKPYLGFEHITMVPTCRKPIDESLLSPVDARVRVNHGGAANEAWHALSFGIFVPPSLPWDGTLPSATTGMLDSLADVVPGQHPIWKQSLESHLCSRTEPCTSCWSGSAGPPGARASRA